MPVELIFQKLPAPVRKAAHRIAPDRQVADHEVLLIGSEHHIVQAVQPLGVLLHLLGRLPAEAFEPQEHDHSHCALAGREAPQDGHDAQQIRPLLGLDIARYEQRDGYAEIDHCAENLILFLGVQVPFRPLDAVCGEHTF